MSRPSRTVFIISKTHGVPLFNEFGRERGGPTPYPFILSGSVCLTKENENYIDGCQTRQTNTSIFTTPTFPPVFLSGVMKKIDPHPPVRKESHLWGPHLSIHNGRIFEK